MALFKLRYQQASSGCQPPGWRNPVGGKENEGLTPHPRPPFPGTRFPAVLNQANMLTCSWVSGPRFCTTHWTFDQRSPMARPGLLAHTGTPPELAAVFLEMRCVEPPPVNPLQRIQQSAAQQHAARNGRGHRVR